MQYENCNTLALFVASSDNTRDVFKTVGQSFPRYWPICRYQKYVGLNTTGGATVVMGFTPVLAPVGGWRQELRAQIAQLREEYVLLMLDDFLLLAPVNEIRINHLVSLAAERDIDYLRLIPLTGSWVDKILARLVSRLRGEEVVPVPSDMPYFSSLQAAIWRREHLLDMLDSYPEKMIWNFEHHSLPGRKHFAVAYTPPIRYEHLVEKGQWLPYAQSRLIRHGIKTICDARPVWPRTYRLRIYFGKFVFGLIGYSWLKAKRKARERTHG